MSHFAVGVITHGQPSHSEIDEILAPYQENNMGDCPEDYLEFEDVTKESQEEYNKGTIKKVRLPDGRYVHESDEMFQRHITEEEYKRADNGDSDNKSRGYKDGVTYYYIIDISLVPGAEVGTFPFKEVYPTFEEFVEEYCGYTFNEEEEAYGYWYNPNARWDWYEIGGRWAGMIRVSANSVSGNKKFRGSPSFLNKDSESCYVSEEKGVALVDGARIKDIFLKDEPLYKKRQRFWELYVEGQTPVDDDEKKSIKDCFHKPEFYLKTYKTKENFADQESSFSTYAVITKDGEWHEPGTMGWFAVSSATDEEEEYFKHKYNELVFDNADKNDWFTIVDCHI